MQMKFGQSELTKEMVEKFNKLESLHYNILIKKEEDEFKLCIPDLSIFVEDKDLNEAYKRLENEKNDYFKKMVLLGIEDEICLPRKLRGKNEIINHLKIFSIKLIMIILFFTLTLSIGTALLWDKVNYLNDKITEKVLWIIENR